MTTPAGQLEPVLRPATADVYMKIIRQALGWSFRFSPPRGKFAPPDSGGSGGGGGDDVSLQWLLPSSEAWAAERVFDYIQFLRNDRKVSAKYEANNLRAFIRLAKYMFKDEAVGGVFNFSFICLSFAPLPFTCSKTRL